MSLRTNCSCKLIVWVEITPLRPVSMANRAAGSKYASDLPTPVPASATSEVAPSSASATATASSCCCGRYSKSRDFANTPFLEKACFTASQNPGSGWPSDNAIIAPPSHPVLPPLPSRNLQRRRCFSGTRLSGILPSDATAGRKFEKYRRARSWKRLEFTDPRTTQGATLRPLAAARARCLKSNDNRVCEPRCSAVATWRTSHER